VPETHSDIGAKRTWWKYNNVIHEHFLIVYLPCPEIAKALINNELGEIGW
jgi:hypothetical protein